MLMKYSKVWTSDRLYTRSCIFCGSAIVYVCLGASCAAMEGHSTGVESAGLRRCNNSTSAAKQDLDSRHRSV